MIGLEQTDSINYYAVNKKVEQNQADLRLSNARSKSVNENFEKRISKLEKTCCKSCKENSSKKTGKRPGGKKETKKESNPKKQKKCDCNNSINKNTETKVETVTKEEKETKETDIKVETKTKTNITKNDNGEMCCSFRDTTIEGIKYIPYRTGPCGTQPRDEKGNIREGFKWIEKCGYFYGWLVDVRYKTKYVR